MWKEYQIEEQELEALASIIIKHYLFEAVEDELNFMLLSMLIVNSSEPYYAVNLIWNNLRTSTFHQFAYAACQIIHQI